MIINIKKMKVANSKLGKLLEQYYENINNVNKIYEGINTSWHDSDSYSFEVEREVENTAFLKYYNELKIISEYYKKIITLYSKYGNTINIDIEKIPEVINKLNLCVEMIKSIKIRFKSITILSNPDLKKCIDDIVKILNLISTEISTLSDDIRDIYKKIVEVEKVVHHEIIKLNIDEIRSDNV